MRLPQLGKHRTLRMLPRDHGKVLTVGAPRPSARHPPSRRHRHRRRCSRRRWLGIRQGQRRNGFARRSSSARTRRAAKPFAPLGTSNVGSWESEWCALVAEQSCGGAGSPAIINQMLVVRRSDANRKSSKRSRRRWLCMSLVGIPLRMRSMSRASSENGRRRRLWVGMPLRLPRPLLLPGTMRMRMHCRKRSLRMGCRT